MLDMLCVRIRVYALRRYLAEKDAPMRVRVGGTVVSINYPHHLDTEGEDDMPRGYWVQKLLDTEEEEETMPRGYWIQKLLFCPSCAAGGPT